MAPPAGRRPVLLLSRNRAYSIRGFVTVAPATRTIRGLETEIRMTRAEGMPEESVVNLDDIQTIEKSRIDEFVLSLPSDKMLEVERAIHYALGLTT